MVITYLLAATDSEIESAFHGWILWTQQYSEFATQTRINPFTGMPMTFRARQPIGESPKCDSDAVMCGDLRSLKKIDQSGMLLELDLLAVHLMNLDSDSVLAQMGGRTLIGPEDSEEGAFELPREFVIRLAQLRDSQLPRVAVDWAKQWRDGDRGIPNEHNQEADCLSRLIDIVDLCRYAIESNRNVFMWSSP